MSDDRAPRPTLALGMRAPDPAALPELPAEAGPALSEPAYLADPLDLAELVEDADIAVPGEAACPSCATVVDAEDVFCGACGAKLPDAPPGGGVLDTGVRPLRCTRCRAALLVGSEQQRPSCAWCDVPDLEPVGAGPRTMPAHIVPFAVVGAEAEAVLRSWLGVRVFKPADLVRRAGQGALRRVYVPHWHFTCDVHTYWTADTDAVPPGRPGEWAPAFGQASSTVTGLLVSASAVLSQRHAELLGHYDLDEAAAYDPAHVPDVPMEQPAVPRRTARAVASSRLIAREHGRCATLLSGRRIRHLRINPLIENMRSTLVLLPAWTLTYTHRGRVRRFILNGQTGAARGRSPLCPFRLAGAAALGVLLLLLLWTLLTRS